MTMIKKVHEILPITKIIVETAQFDIQKINKPEIESVEYQQGEQLGFWNVREFILFRDNHTCQHCKGKSKDKILNVNHIESRLTGGDSPNNLVTLCETCHNDYHKGKIDLKIKRGKKFNHARKLDRTKVNKASISYKKLLLRGFRETLLSKGEMAIPHRA